MINAGLWSTHTDYFSGYFAATKLQKIGIPLVQVKISVKDYLLMQLIMIAWMLAMELQRR